MYPSFSEPLQLGGTVDLQTISTPSSFIPRAINSKVKVHVLGKSVNVFEVSKKDQQFFILNLIIKAQISTKAITNFTRVQI